MNLDWRQDLLGPDFQYSFLSLRPTAGVRPTACLVRSLLGQAGPSDRAVLYLHGYNDYFFQSGLAEWSHRMGCDFYALDLRRYGRSLQEGETPNFTLHLSEYFEELDAALAAILFAGTKVVTGLAHSTGGLTMPLWISQGGAAAVDSLILNSPFLQFAQPAAVRSVVGGVSRAVGRARPLVQLPAGVSTSYGDSLHLSARGEWDYSLEWKPSPGFPPRLGWLNAITEGHRQLAQGLDLTIPILSMSSTDSFRSSDWDDRLMHSDSVLDADSIAARAWLLGSQVTVQRIPGGMHDLFLSPLTARQLAYQKAGDWMAANTVAPG